MCSLLSAIIAIECEFRLAGARGSCVLEGGADGLRHGGSEGMVSASCFRDGRGNIESENSTIRPQQPPRVSLTWRGSADLTCAEMMDAQSFIGRTISHYKIVDKLGAGGMGVVYKALDLKLERTVALKFLPHDAAVDAQDKERFLREARSASALDHENIGVIHGLDEGEDGQLFIVMGYYEGETLQKVLRRGGLPVGEGLQVAVQVARGLAAAHGRKIVHRDIKPSNIIITPTGVAKIVDFGLARVAATAEHDAKHGGVGDSPAYMSPEQTTGGVADPRSDVWALGVVMVEIFTGAHPFQRENTAALTFAILNQPPAVLDAVPPLIQPIVYRALAKDPAHRYASAGEMCSELENVRSQVTAQTDANDASGLTATSTASKGAEAIQGAGVYSAVACGRAEENSVAVAGGNWCGGAGRVAAVDRAGARASGRDVWVAQRETYCGAAV